jgi:hypothetical protein
VTELAGHRRIDVRLAQTIYLAALACVVLFVLPLSAQSPNGTINGLVLDPAGRAIAGADIVIVNDLTRVKYFSKTNGEGIYVVPNLPPGPYRLQVSKIGFNTLIKPDIVLNVQDALSITFTLPIGAVSETITVEGGAPLINTESGAVGTVVDRQFVENLPLNGRSFNTLLQLTPGVIITPVAPNGTSPGQFSVAGQRSDANNFTVDGVSANFGVGISSYAGQSGTGTAQAFSALGGTSSLVSVDALQEFRIQTSSFAPEFGRSPGGQVVLTTRSGTNDLHGGVFEYFRNEALDANDWFANNAGLPRAAERHNDFGGFLGGRLRKDRTFFFLSYEAARLMLPKTTLVQVPSSFARTQASSETAPFLDAFPLPNQPVDPASPYTANFVGTFSNRATLNAGSARIDHTFNQHFTVFGRYNEAPSQIANRTNSLSQVTSSDVNTRTLTASFNSAFDHWANTFRGNYSTQSANQIARLDDYGGATPPDQQLLLGTLSGMYSYVQIFGVASYVVGPYARNRDRQLNFGDDLQIVQGKHAMKFGIDYRVIKFQRDPSAYQVGYGSASVQQFVSSGTANIVTANMRSASLLARSLSAYAQDTWKISTRATLVYGLRWELAPAPEGLDSTVLASWQNIDDPSQISLAKPGTSLWSTIHHNFAPRLGVAYALSKNGDLVLRAGAGLFYDLGLGAVGNLATSFPNFSSAFTPGVSVPVADLSPYLPSPPSQQPPYSGVVMGFAPNLTLPRSYQWNLAIEKSFGSQQALSATYVGQAGRQLLRQKAWYQPNSNFTGDFLLTENAALSNYHALQIQFRRRILNGLQALLNYSWSHSLDDASNDVVTQLAVISASQDYGASDFDVRHSFSGALSYQIPQIARNQTLSLLTRNWTLDGVIVARSGLPFNGIVLLQSPDPGFNATSRPDLVPGQPYWIRDPHAPGGKTLNPSAFSVPTTPRQGTEARNDIPGFRLAQVDLSIGRDFRIKDRVNLKFRTDAFNVLNHPNFSNPLGYVEFGPTYLQSIQMLNQALGGLNPLFQEGGPRSLQLSLKLTF